MDRHRSDELSHSALEMAPLKIKQLSYGVFTLSDSDNITVHSYGTHITSRTGIGSVNVNTPLRKQITCSPIKISQISRISITRNCLNVLGCLSVAVIALYTGMYQVPTQYSSGLLVGNR